MRILDRLRARDEWREAYADASDTDLEVLSVLVRYGARLTEPRHVLHYAYFPTQEAADAAADAARERGFDVDVLEPDTDTGPDWAVISGRRNEVLSPAAVHDNHEFFAALATTHAGEYDGWEASVV